MRSILLIAIVAATADLTILDWMESAFYPVLLGILIIASLGVPIPEDIPLIAAGVILQTHPSVASWEGAFATAMCGIMCGDLVLYTMGKRWGRDVVRHRWFRSLITTERFDLMADRFHRWGMWMCFFGRFFMGVRGVMCITAGATGFPYWRFFIADFCGALLSVPFFIWLGYKFAYMLPTLREYVGHFQGVTIALISLAVAGYLFYEWRKFRRTRRINIEYAQSNPAPSEPASDRRARAKVAADPGHTTSEEG